MNANLKKTVLTAVFMALICVATMSIQIPMPLTNGYVNLGDAFVLTAAWMLGAPWGIAAAGIGSALADMLTGYMHYVPGTLIIKACMAAAAVLIAKACGERRAMMKYTGRIAGALLAELIMIAGYFGYACLLLGKNLGAAAASIPGNAIQGAVGLIVGILLTAALEKTGVMKKLGFAGNN